MRYENEIGSATEPKFIQIKTVYPVTFSNGRVYPVTNLYHFRRAPGTWHAVTLSQLNTAFIGNFDASLSAALQNDAGAGSIQSKFLDLPTNDYGPAGVMTQGQVSGDRLPLYNTAVCQLKTGVRGRNYKGSKHYAPVAESSTTEDNLTGAGLALWQDVRQSLEDVSDPGFMNDAAGNHWYLTVISTTLSDLVSSPCLFTGADVTEVLLNVRIGTMKKRKEKSL